MPLRGTTNSGRSPPLAKVTYESLYAYTMVIIAVITFVLDFTDRRK